jgi:5-methyltetrahydrofolate--homocysteine methyltransferase
MLKRIIEGRWLTANGVVTLLPANAVGDDIVLYTDEARAKAALTWHNLRQQNERPAGKPNYCLADFVAPKASGIKDYLGAFAVTAGLGSEKKLAEFAAKKDDYSAIMLKALADRMAEAFAEWLHVKVRRELWGYARDECLDTAALIRIPWSSGAGLRVSGPQRKGTIVRAAAGSALGMTLAGARDAARGQCVQVFTAHPDATYFAVQDRRRPARRPRAAPADGPRSASALACAEPRLTADGSIGVLPKTRVRRRSARALRIRAIRDIDEGPPRRGDGNGP